MQGIGRGGNGLGVPLGAMKWCQRGGVGLCKQGMARRNKVGTVGQSYTEAVWHDCVAQSEGRSNVSDRRGDMRLGKYERERFAVG